nr:MAG TPA: hypothetical protein [Caudoviricetes sp.]
MPILGYLFHAAQSRALERLRMAQMGLRDLKLPLANS